MKEKYIDSTLLDKAIIFAVKAHKNTERRGKGFPYIVHPMEALGIVATMTNDQEVLAAAVLHDTVEDTDITLDDIEKEFGKRVRDIVSTETDRKDGEFATMSWLDRKKYALNVIRNASKECKMVALGDKLSNIRAMLYDYQIVGEGLWSRFHDNNKANHAWRYHALVDALSELEEYTAYKEFRDIVNYLFKEK